MATATRPPPAEAPQPVCNLPEHHAAVGAHYVIHSKRMTPKGHRIDAYSAYVSPKIFPASEADYASAGAAANLAYAHRYDPAAGRHSPRLVALDTRRRTTRTPRQSWLSTASSKAAFRSAQDYHAENEEARDVVSDLPLRYQDEFVEDEPDAKAAATSAITGAQRRKAEPGRRVSKAYIKPAMTAATTSHVAYGEEPVLVDQEAMDKTRQRLYTTYDMEYERQRERDRHAEAVTMAQQMYSMLPQAEELAAAEVESEPSDWPQRRWTTLEGRRRRPADLHSVAEKRPSAQIAGMDTRYRYYQRRPQSMVVGEPTRRRSMLRRWSSVTESDEGLIMRRRQRKPFQRFRQGEEEEEPEPVDTPLMMAAKRNKDLTMQQIEEDIYHRKGKPSREKMEEWEREAHELQTGRGQTTTFIPGAGRQFDDQAEVEKLARRRLDSTFADIDDRVNKRRGEDVAAQFDEAYHARWLARQRERESEVARIEREIEGKMHKSDKALIKEQKAAEKQKRKEEKKAEKAAKKAAKKKKGTAYPAEETARTEEEVSPTAGPERAEQAYEGTAVGGGAAGAAGAAAVGPSLPTGRETQAAMQAAPMGIAEAEQIESEPLCAIPETTVASEPSGEPKSTRTPERRESRRRSWFGRSRSRNEPSGTLPQEEPSQVPTTEEMAGTSSAAATGPAAAAAAAPVTTVETTIPSSQMAGHEGAETVTVPASATATKPTAPAALQEEFHPVSHWSPSETSVAPAPVPGVTTSSAVPTGPTTAATTGNGVAGPVKTTTVKKQRRTWRSIFTRSAPARNTEGRQGSFDAQRMSTGRNIGEQAGTDANMSAGAGASGATDATAGEQGLPQASQVGETGSTPTPSVGKFQEVL